MTNYFIVNKTTGKLILHFEKETYLALSDEDKRKVKSNFLFSRKTGAWVSRCKFPNLGYPTRVAKDLGLEDGGVEGEALSFEAQQKRKMEKAERRAERMEYKAEKAYQRGKELQKPINDMHGDIAFFTQPNINTSAGRAFTNQRNRMFAAWEKGFDEFRKSAYYTERAERARATANGNDTKDIAFCQRRIDEAESSIRKLQKNIKEYQGYLDAINNGKTPKNQYGWEIKSSKESIERNIDHWSEMLELEIGKSIYYHECIEAQGGIMFSKDNLHKGDLIEITKFRNCIVRIVRFGKKNITYEYTDSNMHYADGSPMQGKCAYAEVKRIVKSA